MKALFLIALLSGCGKEVGRVPFTESGSGDEKMQLDAKEVAFWSDMDLEWEGDASGRYEIELLKKGDKVGSASCNLLAAPKVKMSWVETNIGGKHSRRGRGKLDCSVDLSSAGEYEVRVKLKASSNITLRKADLVVKQ
jgi:hypothetical protein